MPSMTALLCCNCCVAGASHEHGGGGRRDGGQAGAQVGLRRQGRAKVPGELPPGFRLRCLLRQPRARLLVPDEARRFLFPPIPAPLTEQAKILFAKDNFWGRTTSAISSSTDPDSYEVRAVHAVVGLEFFFRVFDVRACPVLEVACAAAAAGASLTSRRPPFQLPLAVPLSFCFEPIPKSSVCLLPSPLGLPATLHAPSDRR